MNPQVSLVTGGAGEIGQSIVRSLLAKNHHVIINYKGASDESSANSLIRSLTSNLAKRIKLLRADVSNPQEVTSMFEEAIHWKGQLHHLVNNAAIGVFKPVAEVTDEDILNIVSVNFYGTLYTCRAAATQLSEGGSIVNLSSSSTSQMLPGYGLYSATKGAVEQLSRVLAKELGTKGINFNVVSPGPIDTEAFHRGKTDEFVDRLKHLSPHRRLGQPKEVGYLVAFLTSEEASWINGQVIKVNGGTV